MQTVAKYTYSVEEKCRQSNQYSFIPRISITLFWLTIFNLKIMKTKGFLLKVAIAMTITKAQSQTLHRERLSDAAHDCIRVGFRGASAACNGG